MPSLGLVAMRLSDLPEHWPTSLSSRVYAVRELVCPLLRTLDLGLQLLRLFSANDCPVLIPNFGCSALLLWVQLGPLRLPLLWSLECCHMAGLPTVTGTSG